VATIPDAMQIEHVSVQQAEPGADIGIKVPQHAREHDKVLKVAP
jgi:hypothetical protein